MFLLTPFKVCSMCWYK